MKAPVKIPCAECAHARTGLASKLDARQLERFEQDKTTQVVHPGQTLFCEGGPAQSLQCVRSGLFKLFKLGVGGEPLVLRFAPPGTSLGLCSAMSGLPHEDTAEALVDSVVCSVPIATFESCATACPEMAFGVIRRLALELREAHDRMTELAHCDVTQRTARLLLNLHEQLERVPAGGAQQRSYPRHVDLAAMIGTTPESLSRVLHALRLRRVIEVTRDRIQVTDPVRLRAIARVAAEPE